jgi:membrane fusion protein, multidrug efflux system
MKRLTTWVVVLAVVAGLLWWQREAVVPFIVRQVPASEAWLAKVPALAALTRPHEAGSEEGETSGRRSRRGGSGGGPVAVVVAEAQMKDLPETIDAVGAANAWASILIRPRIDSQVATVNVAEGAKVAEGETLFTLDDRAIRAELAQIEAQIQRDHAQIEQAQRDVDRANDLLARNAGNVVTRDTAATALKVAQAQLAADEASRDATRTTLTYTVIKAPVAGRIGSIPTKPGAIVRSSDTLPLAIVRQVDPSLVSFAIPQKRLAELRDAMAKGPVKVQVTVGRYTLDGEVEFVENEIDAATGTITVKARVPNPEERLWPGAYVTVVVILDSGEPTVAVPANAVQLGQQGPYVFVVKDGNSVELRQIEVTRNAGADAIVAGGLKAGERVVVDGQLRLVDGARITIKAGGTDEVAATEKPKS